MYLFSLNIIFFWVLTFNQPEDCACVEVTISHREKNTNVWNIETCQTHEFIQGKRSCRKDVNYILITVLSFVFLF